MTQSDWHAAAAAASVTRLSGCRGGARAAGRPGSLVTRRRTRAGPGLDQSVAATVTVTVTAAPGPFSDQPQSHWHGGAMSESLRLPVSGVMIRWTQSPSRPAAAAAPAPPAGRPGSGCQHRGPGPGVGAGAGQ